MTMSLGFLLMATLALSCLSTSIFKQQDGALAQQYIQTTKHRNLVIDLGNGLKTNAQLTVPAKEKDHFLVFFLFPARGLMIEMEHWDWCSHNANIDSNEKDNLD